MKHAIAETDFAQEIPINKVTFPTRKLLSSGVFHEYALLQHPLRQQGPRTRPWSLPMSCCQRVPQFRRQQKRAGQNLKANLNGSAS